VWCVVVGRQGKMTTPINVSYTPGVSSDPAMCSDAGGRVAVVWCDSSSGHPDIFTRISRDDLQDVSYAMDLSRTRTIGPCKEPAVALLGGNAFFIWEQESGPHSLISVTSLTLKDVGTGPSFDIHLKSANGRRVEF
jgi:hypothetical protein